MTFPHGKRIERVTDSDIGSPKDPSKSSRLTGGMEIVGILNLMVKDLSMKQSDDPESISDRITASGIVSDIS